MKERVQIDAIFLRFFKSSVFVSLYPPWFFFCCLCKALAFRKFDHRLLLAPVAGHGCAGQVASFFSGPQGVNKVHVLFWKIALTAYLLRVPLQRGPGIACCERWTSASTTWRSPTRSCRTTLCTSVRPPRLRFAPGGPNSMYSVSLWNPSYAVVSVYTPASLCLGFFIHLFHETSAESKWTLFQSHVRQDFDLHCHIFEHPASVLSV